MEGEAIRFGLLAVKNVGQGAIESIIAAREEGGPFRSFADFCNRIDLRLVNKRVLESLVKVGALNALGHPAQLLLALDDVLAAAQADQRERASGQISFFDLAAEPAALEAPLPAATEVPVRERLRWEKELLGLYLSDHPLGEVAERIGRFVTAYSGELKDESLDGQRVVVGGVVTGVRTVVTKARSTMAVATLEDLQGSVEVVVFPTALRADRPDLAGGRDPPRRRPDRPPRARRSRSWPTWCATSTRRSPPARRRSRPRSRRPTGAARGAGPDGNGNGEGERRRPAGPARGSAARAAGRRGRLRRRRSAAAPGGPDGRGPAPRGRPGPSAELRWQPPSPCPGSLEPRRPRGGRARPRGAALPRGDPRGRARTAAAPTVPREAGPDGSPPRPLRRRHPGRRPPGGHGAVRDVLRGRPGPRASRSTCRRAPGRPTLPMELRAGVAYDAELAAEVARRLRPGLVELALAADADGLAHRRRLTAAAGSARSGAPAGRPTARSGQPPWTARIARTTESWSRCSARMASKSAGSMSSSAAISFRTALSGDEISSSAAATRKQARRTPRRCSALATRA